MKIGLKLKETNKQIEKKILDTLKTSVKAALTRSAPNIQRRIQASVKKRLEASPAWGSLQGGKLQGELGLNHPKSRLETILQIWLASLQVVVVNPKPTGNGFRGGIKIRAIKSNYSDVLAASQATITTEDGSVLPWLEWLLTYGDSVIVTNYEVEFSPRGRSGLAVMVKKRGATWRVPPEFSGTSSNNFVIEALDGIQDEMAQIIKKEIEKRVT